MFMALALTVWRKMLDVVKGLPGCRDNDVVKHLRFFEVVGLVVSQKTASIQVL
jgi:hypothetical protein